jgi:hypothetical protein
MPKNVEFEQDLGARPPALSIDAKDETPAASLHSKGIVQSPIEEFAADHSFDCIGSRNLGSGCRMGECRVTYGRRIHRDFASLAQVTWRPFAHKFSVPRGIRGRNTLYPDVIGSFRTDAAPSTSKLDLSEETAYSSQVPAAVAALEFHQWVIAPIRGA